MKESDQKWRLNVDKTDNAQLFKPLIFYYSVDKANRDVVNNEVRARLHP